VRRDRQSELIELLPTSISPHGITHIARDHMLCDEVRVDAHITDIDDAMILERLFEPRDIEQRGAHTERPFKRSALEPGASIRGHPEQDHAGVLDARELLEPDRARLLQISAPVATL